MSGDILIERCLGIKHLSALVYDLDVRMASRCQAEVDPNDPVVWDIVEQHAGPRPDQVAMPAYITPPGCFNTREAMRHIVGHSLLTTIFIACAIKHGVQNTDSILDAFWLGLAVAALHTVRGAEPMEWPQNALFACSTPGPVVDHVALVHASPGRIGTAWDHWRKVVGQKSPLLAAITPYLTDYRGVIVLLAWRLGASHVAISVHPGRCSLDDLLDRMESSDPASYASLFARALRHLQEASVLTAAA